MYVHLYVCSHTYVQKLSNKNTTKFPNMNLHHLFILIISFLLRPYLFLTSYLEPERRGSHLLLYGSKFNPGSTSFKFNKLQIKSVSKKNIEGAKMR